MTESDYGRGQSGWRAEWGGALRLYPTETVVEEDGREVKIPLPEHTVAIPPAWNQLAFFAVQPGESFHDVEEVYSASAGPVRRSDEDTAIVGKGKTKVIDDGSEVDDEHRVRIAISGWYHVPQEGEPGYEPISEDDMMAKSSLSQLQSKSMDKYDLPAPRWRDYSSVDALRAVAPTNGTTSSTAPAESNLAQDVELTESDLDFLIKYITPSYLTPDTVEKLADTFEEESCLQLSVFLRSNVAEKLRTDIESAEQEGEDCMPGSSTFAIARPPHKHRFLYRQPQMIDADQANNYRNHNQRHQPQNQNQNQDQERDQEPSVSPSTYDDILESLFPSSAFRKYLSLITGGGLSLQRSNIVARRFRRGKDYTLATPYEEDRPRLEVCFGITPSFGWAVDEGDEDTEDEEDIVYGAELGDESGDGARGAKEGYDRPIGESSRSSANGASTNKPSAATQPPWFNGPKNQDINTNTTTTSTTNNHNTHFNNKNHDPQPTPKIPPGGHDVYMSTDDDDNDDNTDPNNNNKNKAPIDPAVYQTHPAVRYAKGSADDPDSAATGAAADEDHEEDPASSPILFSAPPAFNVLNVVLRDKGVLRFTKYVGASGAPGDRWDVLGEWEVGFEDGDGSGEKEEGGKDGEGGEDNDDDDDDDDDEI